MRSSSKRCAPALPPMCRPAPVVLIASKGDEDLVRVEGYRGWHFPRDEWGSYAGHHPASSVEAIGICGTFTNRAPATWYFRLPPSGGSTTTASSPRSSPGRIELVSLEGVCASTSFWSCRRSARSARRTTATRRGRPIGAEHPTSELLSVQRPSAGQPLRVLTILARYGTDQYPRAEEEIADLFVRRMGSIERRVVIVDNQRPPDYIDERAGSTVIGGDNSHGSFRRSIARSVSSEPTSGPTTSCIVRRVPSIRSTWPTSSGSTRRCFRSLRAGPRASVISIATTNRSRSARIISALDPVMLLLSAAHRGHGTGQFRVDRRRHAVLHRQSGEPVSRRRAIEPPLPPIHQPVVDRRRRRPGRDLAFDL